MKHKHREIKIFQETINNLKTENILDLKQTSKKEIYCYKGFQKIKDEETGYSSNIFQEYNPETYKIYKEIAKMLDSACVYYSIDKDRQKYFVKGKIFEYTTDNNKDIFDFPGKDIPIFHGFVILGQEGVQQTYYTNSDKKIYVFNKNTITLSSPTNFINTKVEKSCLVIEYYLAPLSSIAQNEPNLWIPIL